MRIYLKDNPWVSPDPCGEFDTLGQIMARLRELGLEVSDVEIR